MRDHWTSMLLLLTIGGFLINTVVMLGCNVADAIDAHRRGEPLPTSDRRSHVVWRGMALGALGVALLLVVIIIATASGDLAPFETVGPFLPPILTAGFIVTAALDVRAARRRRARLNPQLE